MTDTCAHLLLQANLFVFLEYFEEPDFIVLLQPRGERQVAVFSKSTTSLLCPLSLLFRLKGQNDPQLLLLTSWGGAVSSQDLWLSADFSFRPVTHNCTMIFATVGRLCYVSRNIKTVFDCTWSMTTKWYSPLTDYITLKDKPRKNICERNSNVCILCV